MKDRQFVDTNILVYAHDKTAGHKHEQAKQLLSQLWQDDVGCLSIQVLQEFHNVITRRLKQSVLQSVDVINSYKAWRIHSPTVDDVIFAIQLQNRFQTSFWDALILHSASKLQCRVMWSEDLNNGQFYGDVQVKNPFV